MFSGAWSFSYGRLGEVEECFWRKGVSGFILGVIVNNCENFNAQQIMVGMSRTALPYAK